MSRRFRMIPLVSLALVGVAVAQAPEPEGTLRVQPEAAAPAMPASGEPGEVGPDGTYTIKTGDTLWDLSQRFLNNPWYWPKIWADNPAVENPHWIYPGNGLRIRYGADGLPSEIQPVTEGEEYVPEDAPLSTRPSELADFTTGTVDHADSLGQASDLVSVSGRRGVGIASPTSMNVRVASLVTAGELAQSGTITSSFEEKEMLTTFDRCYITFKDLNNVRVGGIYSVFRTGREIVHPVTQVSYGYQTIILGTMKILSKEHGFAVGEVAAVNHDIGRGDRIGDEAELDRHIRPVANRKELAGIVLATEIANQVWIGESHVVFVDQGSEQGVEQGNTFTVVQSGDGLKELELAGRHQGTSGLPVEPIATLLVFDVRARTSAAMVVKSLREVGVGDRVEMRAGGAGGD